MTKEKTVTITMDNKKLQVKSGLTILQAAKANNIYIPSLCAFEHLPSYGACRLCIVEVDGIRGFPTSCTTPVEDGMVIRTETQELRNLRQEILKLLLSEHPASCLFCSDKEECINFQGTIRKVGNTTGCRYCPNDHRCEIQTIVEKIGLTETSYPVYYRNFPVEKYDPFYDRDYNLCILCGRCIRVCNDIRLNGTLSFKQRGQQTTIGPAFDRTHLEAGCEFCGACVNVCPTGTLSVKTGKWYGKHDKEGETVCNFCSIGCKLILQAKNESIVDSLPDYDSPIDKGLICVKGRFCITEYVHSPSRYSTPMEMTPVGYNNITWEKALDIAALKIKGVKPDDVLMLISAQLLNEDIYCAQQFMRKVIGSENIIPTPLIYLNNDFAKYWNLCIESQPLEVIENTQFILAVGFDSTYGYSPIGIRIKKAAKSGAYLLTLNDKETNLDLLASASFKVEKKAWYDVIEIITSRDGIKKKHTEAQKILKESARDLEGLKNSLLKTKDKLIVIGQDVLNHPERTRLLHRFEEIIIKGGWKIIVANPYTNFKGTVMLGGFPYIMPADILKSQTGENVKTINSQILNFDLNKKRRIIYIIGDAPNFVLPECDFLIYQNAIPATFEKKPDLILPSALFPETEGTLINMEDRILKVKKFIEPYMESKPDWWIIGAIGERLKKGKLKFKDIQSIHGEIKKLIKGFSKIKDRFEFSRINVTGIKKTDRFTPVPEAKRPIYRGIALSEVVSGMKVIERSIDE